MGLRIRYGRRYVGVTAMLKVYRVYDCVSIDSAEWREIGDRGYRITDEDISDVIILDNASFAQTREYLRNKICIGMHNSETFFRHKPLIDIHYSDAWDYVSYRHFDTLSYKRVYVEWTTASMQWLMEHATADQFIQYLKERGITTCPMNF